MIRSTLMVAATTVAFTLGSAYAVAADTSVLNAPPAEPYKAVSSLVKLPDFVPGLGQLFVAPDTLPAGPFLGYDHDSKLVTTTYMIPLSMMKPDMNLKDLKAPADTVDHVDILYNAGHPGVQEPHIHIILWNVPSAEESRVAK